MWEEMGVNVGGNGGQCGRLDKKTRLINNLIHKNPLLNMSKDLIVIKSNLLNEARYKLSKEEQKLLLYVVAMLKEDGKNFLKGSKIYVKDFVSLLGISGHNKYERVALMTENLLGKRLIIRTTESLKQMNWFTTFEYIWKDGTVDVKMNPDIIEYFIDLKRHFVKYKLSNILTLKSVYSIRIYELMKQNFYKKKVIYSLEELKEILGVEIDEYKRSRDFRINVLDKAFEEINDKTDIKFSFKEIRKGRTVTDIEFEISESTKNESEVLSMDTGELIIIKPTEIKSIDVSESKKEKLSLSKAELVEKALLLTIPSHLTNKWIEIKGMDIVNNKLELLIKRKKTQNIASPVGFFISAIQQDWEDETQISNKLTQEQEKEQRKKNPVTVMVEPLSFKTEVEFYEEISKLEIDFYSPRWIERDMEQAEKNWAKEVNP
jgi:plasmid replication initiation protein